MYLEADQEEDQPESLKDCRLKDPIREYSELLTCLQVEVRRLCTQRMIQKTVLIGTFMGTKCDDEYLNWGTSLRITVTDYSEWSAVTGALPPSPTPALHPCALLHLWLGPGWRATSANPPFSLTFLWRTGQKYAAGSKRLSCANPGGAKPPPPARGCPAGKKNPFRPE